MLQHNTVPAICATAIAGIFVTTLAKADGEGVWEAGNWAQINVGCFQTWVCEPTEDMLIRLDQVIVKTPPNMQVGVCSAGGGPADSCNACLTTPPEEPCLWRIENK
jgi:hypothetical protein